MKLFIPIDPSELARAAYQCDPDELRVLMYLASKANFNPEGYPAKIYWKKTILKRGQVPPTALSIIPKTLRLDPKKIQRIYKSLRRKGFITYQTFPRGGKNGKGYTIITVGVISGVSLSVPHNDSLKPLNNNGNAENDVPQNDPLNVLLSIKDKSIKPNLRKTNIKDGVTKSITPHSQDSEIPSSPIDDDNNGPDGPYGIDNYSEVPVSDDNWIYDAPVYDETYDSDDDIVSNINRPPESGLDLSENVNTSNSGDESDYFGPSESIGEPFDITAAVKNHIVEMENIHHQSSRTFSHIDRDDDSSESDDEFEDEENENGEEEKFNDSDANIVDVSNAPRGHFPEDTKVNLTPPEPEQEELKKNALSLLEKERDFLIESYRNIVEVTPVSAFSVHKTMRIMYGSKKRLLEVFATNRNEYEERLNRVINFYEDKKRDECEEVIESWEK